MTTYTIQLKRQVGKRVADEKLRTQIAYLIGRGLGGNRAGGWTYKVSVINAQPLSPTLDTASAGYAFTTSIRFSTDRTQERADKAWCKISRYFLLACVNTKFRQYPWRVTSGMDATAAPEYGLAVSDAALRARIAALRARIDGVAVGGTTTPTPTSDAANEVAGLPVHEIRDYATGLNLVPGDKFDHIFDRKHQLNVLHSAIKAAVATEFTNRFHCVLFGPPGCGKTDLLLSTGAMLGAENSAFMKFDATSTTAAGASRLLLDSPYIPPVLIVEEIEKTDEASLRWMLGVLDQRAEIRRTNFRIGNRARNVKMLVLATVNDIGLFRKVMSGALASRFPNQIYCPRPSRDVLAKILRREVDKVHGDPAWIEPTLQYAFDQNHLDDPRKLVPICLGGREQLLTGEYQRSLEATKLPIELDKAVNGV